MRVEVNILGFPSLTYGLYVLCVHNATTEEEDSRVHTQTHTDIHRGRRDTVMIAGPDWLPALIERT